MAQRYKRFILQDLWKPMFPGILNLLCMDHLTTESGLLERLGIFHGAVSAESFWLRRRGRRQGLTPGRCTTTTDLLTARFGRRCRRSIGVKRLGVPVWLVGRISRRRRRHAVLEREARRLGTGKCFTGFKALRREDHQSQSKKR